MTTQGRIRDSWWCWWIRSPPVVTYARIPYISDLPASPSSLSTAPYVRINSNFGKLALFKARISMKGGVSLNPVLSMGEDYRAVYTSYLNCFAHGILTDVRVYPSSSMYQHSLVFSRLTYGICPDSSLAKT